jgi:4-diphosphocytidyl-2-C-methyl-D-erythritol kinase
MSSLTIYSRAKLNLTFEILGLLPEGYHEIRTVFHSITLSDKLSFELVETVDESQFEVELRQVGAGGGDVAQGAFPLGGDNLIARAALRYASLANCGSARKLVVSVEKNIPIAAGLAGGSSNAAAALHAMQYFFQSPVDLHMVAAELGSDINFCLEGGTQIGANRGEKLHAVESATTLHFVLLKPRNISISTPWIYKQYDLNAASAEERHLNYTQACQRALKTGNVREISLTLHNAFEPVCFEHHKPVRELRDAMVNAGCLTAVITGSGPTLFGLVESANDAEQVCRLLAKDPIRNSQEHAFDCWVVSSAANGLSRD